MKRILSIFVIACILLCGCEGMLSLPQKQRTATYLDLFDTVTSIVGYARSEEEFQNQAQKLHDELLIYHQLFDIYKEYDGINNLKTVNDHAGVDPVVVDRKIVDLLLACKDYYKLTDGKVNVAMGSVLSLWHDARNEGIQDPENARLPDMTELLNAAKHTDMDSIVIDQDASTVYISDPQASLDVGAIAKGWATQQVAESAPEGMLLSVGGNICATGPKQGNASWGIGIRHPEKDENLHVVDLKTGSIVTSGDYQRTYTVDGVEYHHIIDPATQMPAKHWRSVTVIGDDSGLADALSTALFLMPLEEGRTLAEKCGVDALWVDHNGEEFMTAGFRSGIRK